MANGIGFPNLGVFLENVPRSITLFGFEIAFYGILIGLAFIIGFFIAFSEGKRLNLNEEEITNMGIVGGASGIMGARLMYVIFAWEAYRYNLLGIFNFRTGGLAVYGGVIAALVALIIYTKIKKINFLLIGDIAVLTIVNGQMIGRWGNFFNREAFGEYTNNLLAMELPLNDVRRASVTPLMEENISVINGISFIQVHPTFLYESMWNLGLLCFLWFLRKRKKYHGQLLFIYMLGYGVGRFWMESLRTDQLVISGLGLPVSQVIAGLSIVAAVILMVRFKDKEDAEIISMYVENTDADVKVEEEAKTDIITEAKIETEVVPNIDAEVDAKGDKEVEAEL